MSEVVDQSFAEVTLFHSSPLIETLNTVIEYDRLLDYN